MKRILQLFLMLILAAPLTSQEKKLNDGMIFVKGGTFQMGFDKGDIFEKPVHEVTLSSFYISPYEVTQGLWQQVMGGSINHQRAKMKPSGKLRGEGWSHPMYFVSWNEAIEFCNTLSRLNGLKPCYSGEGEDIICDFNAEGYRLPTEAEWEYAARGGLSGGGNQYAGSRFLEEIAWYRNNSSVRTNEVGQKAPNELGLYDMSGNVNEWCWDSFCIYNENPQVDPAMDDCMEYRVYRGGCWSHSAEYSRVTYRMGDLPQTRLNNLGFRIVRSK